MRLLRKLVVSYNFSDKILNNKRKILSFLPLNRGVFKKTQIKTQKLKNLMSKTHEEQFDEKLEEVKTVKALTTKVPFSFSPF